MIILPSRLAPFWIFALGFGASTFTTSAQNSLSSPPPPERRMVRPPPVLSVPSPQSNPWTTRINIDFPGGTLSDFAKKLEPLLVGISRIEIEQNSDAILPPLKLKGGQRLQDLLTMMAVMTHNAFTFELQGSQASPEDDTELILKLSYSPQFIERYPAQRYIREFDFHGGTVQQLGEAIRKEDFGLTNIHVNPSLAAQPIPAFRVEKVTFGQMMTIIQQISDGRCQPNLNGTFLEIGYKPDTRNTTVTATSIYPLRELLKTYRIEDINALVQTALKMRNTRIGTDEKDPDMSLHKETSTLVVVGSPDQVKVVKDVLAALENQPGDANAPSPSPTKDAP